LMRPKVSNRPNLPCVFFRVTTNETDYTLVVHAIFTSPSSGIAEFGQDMEADASTQNSSIQRLRTFLRSNRQIQSKNSSNNGEKSALLVIIFPVSSVANSKLEILMVLSALHLKILFTKLKHWFPRTYPNIGHPSRLWSSFSNDSMNKVISSRFLEPSIP
jgi:hypothetical protein